MRSESDKKHNTEIQIMASDKNTAPKEMNSVETLNKHLTDAGQKIASNKKIVWWVMIIIVVIALIILLFLNFNKNPRDNNSFEAFNNVEIHAMANDSVAAEGYKKVADKFSDTDAGNVAALSAAEYLYEMGKYDQAIKYAEKFSTSDAVLQSNTYIMIGDCYVNLKKYDKALDAFDNAISEADENPEIVPRVLLKKANVYDAQKKYADALACYEKIMNDYPKFQLGNGMTIEAYAEREKARLGK